MKNLLRAGIQTLKSSTIPIFNKKFNAFKDKYATLKDDVPIEDEIPEPDFSFDSDEDKEELDENDWLD